VNKEVYHPLQLKAPEFMLQHEAELILRLQSVSIGKEEMRSGLKPAQALGWIRHSHSSRDGATEGSKSSNSLLESFIPLYL
jgi:hypothetical protein